MKLIARASPAAPIKPNPRRVDGFKGGSSKIPARRRLHRKGAVQKRAAMSSTKEERNRSAGDESSPNGAGTAKVSGLAKDQAAARSLRSGEAPRRSAARSNRRTQIPATDPGGERVPSAAPKGRGRANRAEMRAEAMASSERASIHSRNRSLRKTAESGSTRASARTLPSRSRRETSFPAPEAPPDVSAGSSSVVSRTSPGLAGESKPSAPAND